MPIRIFEFCPMGLTAATHGAKNKEDKVSLRFQYNLQQEAMHFDRPIARYHRQISGSSVWCEE